MKIKDKWTDKDFDNMGWHDSRLYQIKFPDENFFLTLYIDYIFEWVKEKNKFKFWVSPSELIFENVINLKVNLLFENSIGIDISSIEREKVGLTPNKEMMEWRYRINTDKGNIEFLSTGFVLKTISEPVLSESQDLGS